MLKLIPKTLLIVLLSISNLFAQEDIKDIISKGGNFGEVSKRADKFFKDSKRDIKTKDSFDETSMDEEYFKYMRWQSYWKNNLDENGNTANVAAYILAAMAETANKPNLGPFQNRTWTNISNNNFITGQIGMGRTTSIAFHPTDVNTFFVGTPYGGIWKTIDAGINYTPMGDNLPLMAVSSIVINKLNPQIMYIAISDHVWYGSQGMGVLKSVDGGISWTTTALKFDFNENVRIYFMEADPNNPNIMLVATANGIYRTTDGFLTINKVSTLDTYDIHYKIGSSSVAFAGTNDGRFLRSTDGGATFTEITDFGSGDVKVILAPSATDKVYARFGNTLRVSLDGGLTFSTQHSLTESNGVYAFDPDNANVIVGGNFEVYRSNDGGATKGVITNWLGNNGLPLIHVDQRNVFTNPLNADAIYFCNDGGLFKYNINAATWQDLSNGLKITQYYDIAVSQTNANIISGGSQDNGSMYRNAAGTWQAFASTGDGMNTEIDPTNENIRYWEYQNGGFRRYQNGSSVGASPAGKDGTGAWETPFKIDPSNASRIVIGYDLIYASNDRGVNWTAISGTLGAGGNVEQLAIAKSNPERIYVSRGTTMFVKNIADNNWITKTTPATSTISDIEIDPLNSEIVYITNPGYTGGKKVFKSTDAGTTWTNISGTLPNIAVVSIELYHTQAGGMFVGTNMGVYYRDNTLDDWYEYGHLPHTDVRDVEIQYSSQKIRIGTHGRGVIEAPINVTTCVAGDPDTDGDGKCNIVDICPLIPNSQLGLPCNDGDALSIGEVYDKNTCSCSGGIPTLTYCAASGSSGTGGDWIARVNLGTIDNYSTQTLYSDFKSISTELRANTTYTLKTWLNYTFTGDAFDAWIDFNRNGVFETGELIAMSAIASNLSSGTFTVPNLTTFGATVMRVRARYYGSVNPCGNIFGEVEDYTIYLKPENPCETNRVITGAEFLLSENYNYLASNKIVTDNTTVNNGSTLILDAKKSVELTKGFEVKNGAVFQAKIGGCN
jgi:hypothetical protein